MAIFIPLVVRLEIVPVQMQDQDLFPQWQSNLDVFSYWKAQIIKCAGCWAAVAITILLWKKRKEPLPKTLLIGAAIYLLLLWLSVFFSADFKLALEGFPNQYEGAWVWSSYICLMVLAALALQNHAWQKRIVACALITGFLCALIGLLQFVDWYPLNMPLIRDFVFGRHAEESGVYLKLKKDVISSTLANPNYVGSFAALLLPLSLSVFLLCQEKWKRLSLAVLILMLVAMNIGSNSRTGYLGIAVGLSVVAFFNREKIKAQWKALTVLALLSGLIFLLMSSPNSSSVRIRSQHVLQDYRAMQFDKLVIQDDLMVMQWRHRKIFLLLKENEWKLLDGEGTALAHERVGDTIRILDPDFRKIRLSIRPYLDTEKKFLRFCIQTACIHLLPTPKGIRIIAWGGEHINQLGKKIEILPKEQTFSNRGYIWSKTLPLLGERFFLGAGAGNFAFDFPNREFSEKFRVMGKPEAIIDKPHNLYFQIAHASGVLSLVALLVIFATYFRDAVRTRTGSGFMGAVLGYLAAGVGNDSVVSVAPVFWVLLGTGLASVTLSKEGLQTGTQDRQEIPNKN